MLIICYGNFWCVIFRVFARVCPLFNIINILSCSEPHPTPFFPQPPTSTPTLPPSSVAISNIHYVETFQISFLNISVCQWTDSWNEVLYFVGTGSIMFISLNNSSLRHSVVFREFQAISLQTIKVILFHILWNHQTISHGIKHNSVCNKFFT